MEIDNDRLVESKVYAYIVKQMESKWQLLVFEHLDFPEAGIQVPGGTVETGESIPAAAIREVQEETGLESVEIIEKLGVSYHDMCQYGLKGFHRRHYFHCRVTTPTERSWIASEEMPSDGSPGPIGFKFYWVNLACVPPLAGRTDEMLHILIRRLNNETG